MLTEDLQHCLLELASGPAHRFSDWPNLDVPAVTAGVYTVWDGDTLVYVGIAGRRLDGAKAEMYRDAKRRTGLYSRLASHASGRRSGDQFCVYVADRFVLPTEVVP